MKQLITFAQTNLPPIPWSTTGGFMLGLIGVLSVAGLFLWVYNQAQKTFGRTPPLQQEFEDRAKGLRSEIYHAKNSAIKEMTSKIDPIIQRVGVLEERYEDMQNDRVRKWNELQREINGLQNDLAFIRGKFERGES